MSELRRIVVLAVLSVLGLALFSAGAPPRPAAATSAFSFQWNGQPASPQPWQPGAVNDWMLAIHNGEYLPSLTARPEDAQHGANCGPFQGYGVGGTHRVEAFKDLVFICNNHLMTVINAGYGEISLVPAQLVDFSSGTTSITWKQSTLRANCRDWLSFDLVPFNDFLLFQNDLGVDLAGDAMNGIHITSGAGAGCPSHYFGVDRRNGSPKDQRNISGGGGSVNDVVSELAPSAATQRVRFELDVSRTHVRFGLPDFNFWMVDGDLASPLPYTRALFQIAQHAYEPDKDSLMGGHASTWHWSDFSISNAVPFTILNGDRPQVTGGDDGSSDGVVNFGAPAPANSFLVMEAIAQPGTLKYSGDGGRTWNCVCSVQKSTDNPSGAFQTQNLQQIFLPIPEGTQHLMFQGHSVSWTGWLVRNIAIFATTQTAGVPPQPPPPAPVPSNPPPPSDTQTAGTQTGGTQSSGGGPDDEQAASAPQGVAPEENESQPRAEPEATPTDLEEELTAAWRRQPVLGTMVILLALAGISGLVAAWRLGALRALLRRR